jgi:hypothetical protein
MSRIISYRGTLAMGLEERISLATIKGKVGYKINKFQLISTAPGTNDYEYVGKITKVADPNIGPVINFTDADMLAVVYRKANPNADRMAVANTIIFDNEKFNQDIFVNITDASGGTLACNYYIELETMELSDLETTMLTLKNMRTVTSR